MKGINEVTLIGNLGHDPKPTYFENDGMVINVSLATTQRWKQKNGDIRKKTEWHRIVAHNGYANAMLNYCGKGSQVYIKGYLQTRNYADKQGVKRYVTEVVVLNVTFLNTKTPGQVDDADMPNPPANHAGYDEMGDYDGAEQPVYDDHLDTNNGYANGEPASAQDYLMENQGHVQQNGKGQPRNHYNKNDNRGNARGKPANYKAASRGK